MIRLFLILTMPFLSCSILDRDLVEANNLAVQDTTTNMDMIVDQSPDSTNFSYQQAETNNINDSPQVTNLCNVDCGFIIQLAAVIIAIVALCINYKQSKNSSKQATKAYNKFVTTSNNQFDLQTNTLKTIKNQTDKIYSNNNKRDFIGYLSDCYTSIGLISKYLKDNFSNIIWNVQTNDYVFGLLQPVIKAATAMEISLSSLEGFDDNEEFVNSIKLCAKLGENEFTKREDVELLIQQLEECKVVFEQFINKLKGGENE